MTEDKQEKGLLYEPPPPVSDFFTEEFNKLVPLCENGKDRKLRFSWGCDVTEYCAGYYTHRYPDIHEPAKYVGRPQWILEGWQSPEIYDEDEWAPLEHLLGAFPRSGAWDFVAFHGGNEYMALDQSALNHVQIWAHWQGQGQKASIDHIMHERMMRWSLEQQRKSAAAGEVAQQFGEDVVRIFEEAKDTPTSFGDQIKKSFGGAFEASPGGILMPKN